MAGARFADLLDVHVQADQALTAAATVKAHSRILRTRIQLRKRARAGIKRVERSRVQSGLWGSLGAGGAGIDGAAGGPPGRGPGGTWPLGALGRGGPGMPPAGGVAVRGAPGSPAGGGAAWSVGVAALGMSILAKTDCRLLMHRLRLVLGRARLEAHADLGRLVVGEQQLGQAHVAAFMVGVAQALGLAAGEGQLLVAQAAEAGLGLLARQSGRPTGS